MKEYKEDKKSISSKNIIEENIFEDLVDGSEELEAIKRLNKAYAKYERKNLGIISE